MFEKLITILKCTNAIYMYFQTKPLKVIWGKYPELYSAHNTIMFDDLRRNFIMNPQSGLKVSQCGIENRTLCDCVLMRKFYVLVFVEILLCSSLQLLVSRFTSPLPGDSLPLSLP